MSSISISNEKKPLQAAQKIVDELTGMTSEQQSLALKFAVETLGLQLPAALSPTLPSHLHSLHSAPSYTSSSAGHSTDIKSFTAMKAPNSDQQFTAVVAYFYQFEATPKDRKEIVDADIMKEAARLAGRPQVTRWNMTLTNAKNAGYLDAVGDGKYKLSSVGENLVAITLPGNDGPRRNKGNGTRKKPANKSAKRNVKKKGRSKPPRN